MTSATEALERLKEGNHRFANDIPGERSLRSGKRRAELVSGQDPFAIVLGCSDSRAPAELVFDQGLGDLFVIRVAGNVVAPSQIGSIEYAAEQTGAELVVVMGHTSCGAIDATLSELKRPSENRSPNLSSIVDRIRPSVESLLEVPGGMDPEALSRLAMRANVRASVDHLKRGSAILENMLGEGSLTIVGAEYNLETGVVEYL